MFLSENINKRIIKMSNSTLLQKKMSNSTAVMKAREHGSQNANFATQEELYQAVSESAIGL
jgi:hypothetical protein